MPTNPGFQRIDALSDIIRGPARILAAPYSIAFPSSLGQIVETAATNGSYASEVQTLSTTGTPTGGTIQLLFMDQLTVPIPYNAAASVVQTALNNLGDMTGLGGVVCSAGPLPTSVVITWNNYGKQPLMSVSSALTGGTSPAATVVETTPGLGQWDIVPNSGWIELGATQGGTTLDRNSAETELEVDQVYGTIMTVPDTWTMTIRVPFASITPQILQYGWELAAPTVDLTQSPTETHIGMGAPLSYVTRRFAILHQKTIGNTAGAIRAHVYRLVNRSPQNGQVQYQKKGAQQVLDTTFRALADPVVTDVNKRFGDIIDQNVI